MYEVGSRYQDTNGYILVYEPSNPKAMKSGAFKGYVYEHVLIAENLIDRPLRDTEQVHHLDFNRSNNSPDNLLVMIGPMHAKLHTWLNKYTLVPNEKQAARNDLGCVRCAHCQTPTYPDQTFCSAACVEADRLIKNQKRRPSKDELERMVWERPTSVIAKEFGVSDVAFSKWCKQAGVNKPPRGHWQKVAFGKVP